MVTFSLLAPRTGLKYCCDYMLNFSSGAKRKFPWKSLLRCESTVNAHAAFLFRPGLKFRFDYMRLFQWAWDFFNGPDYMANFIRIGPDYMANFIPGWNFNFPNRAEISARLLKQILSLKIKLLITWRGIHPGASIQPGLKILARYFQTGLGFSARPNGLKNPCHRYHFFHPGPKKERKHVHRPYFRTWVNFLMEICVLHPRWNWAFNRNNISARWAERNFSTG